MTQHRDYLAQAETAYRSDRIKQLYPHHDEAKRQWLGRDRRRRTPTWLG